MCSGTSQLHGIWLSARAMQTSRKLKLGCVCSLGALSGSCACCCRHCLFKFGISMCTRVYECRNCVSGIQVSYLWPQVASVPEGVCWARPRNSALKRCVSSIVWMKLSLPTMWLWASSCSFFAFVVRLVLSVCTNVSHLWWHHLSASQAF